MGKRGLVLLVLALVLVSGLYGVSAASIEPEIKKLTNYAQDYETGNINYVQLLIYSSAVRGSINEVLGASNKEMGGTLSEEQLKQVLGEPTEKTKWVWVENEQREEKMDKDISAWRKIIFDGKKIQLWFSAWPNIIKKNNEKILVYHLNIDVQFKKPSEQMDISGKISEIKDLAGEFNKEPSTANAEALAQKSVSAERMFESYLKQNQGRCDDIMVSIFGAENKRQSQKMLVQEIEFYSGDNFVVTARLEMCDECEWHWINLDFWFEGRGPGFKQPKTEPGMVSWEQFKGLDDSGFRREIANIIEELKASVQEGNYGKVMEVQNKIRAVNEAWGQQANNVWQEVDKIFEEKRMSMSQQEQEEYNKNYGWIRDEQEKRKQVQEIASENYQIRKEFYLNLFSSYGKKEYYFSQQEYEKRLFEEFVEFGQEICDNNQDDNKNEKADCDDEQCSGKICGKQSVKKSVVDENNETKEMEVMQDMYCISGVCQAKEEIIVIKEIICGDHMCEGNETIENCAEDCSICLTYEAINCSGNVIFKGKDNKGCPLEPICIVENNTCAVNEDCVQPLCGKAECVENVCATTALEECREAECADGEEKVKNCEDGNQIVFEKCIEGLWTKTGVDCGVEKEITTCEGYCAGLPYPTCIGHLEISGTYPDCTCNMVCGEEGPIAGNECILKEDCGNEDDVCSNGKCVTIPKSVVPEEEPIVIEEPAEEGEEQEEVQQSPEESEEAGEEPEQPAEQEPEQPQEGEQEQQLIEIIPEGSETITGQVINTIKTISRKVTGFIISGFDVEEAPQESQEAPTEQQEQPREDERREEPRPSPEQPREDERRDDGERREERREDDWEREEQDRRDDGEREDEERREEDRERQKENCRNGCENPCRDMLIAPCIEKCVREADCKDEECTNSKIDECEASCKQEKDFEGCVDECADKCAKGEGEGFKIEEQKREEPKMEKGVFKVGGACRSAQGQERIQNFIYFDGWGEPFEKVRDYKQKYYNGGQAEWCKDDLKNLVRQRKEFEQGFNEEFVKWFFEKYLANSAGDWEEHVSGIFELYWKDVDNARQMAERLECLEKQELPEHNLISIKYETEFGKIEFWEELKTAKFPGIDKEVQVISPYMKIWIFPPKEFIIYEMKRSMKNHEFPGPKDEKVNRENQEGPTAEEKNMIKQDEEFMEKIREVSEKYGGSVDVVVKFVDYEKDETVFNLYAQVNEDDILKVKPMLPEEISEKDVEIELDFEKLYEIIYTSEKEMRGEQLESPPWDRQTRPIAKVKEIVNGAKMYLKARSLLNSAKISPEESKKDVKFMMKEFFSMMMKGGGKPGEEGKPGRGMGEGEDIGKEKGIWEEKGKITGEIIAK